MNTLLFFLAQSAVAAQLNVPTISFDFWNDQNRVYNNNCYNYGTNRATDSFAQPGEASGEYLTALDCREVLAAAGKDLGVEETTFFNFRAKQEDSLVALVVWPGNDYHWYRRGDDNMWSHKMGGSPAVDTDDSGNKISNPETADRGSYTKFCGYFKIKNYISQPDEQNGGFVRIGNMSQLPSEPPHSEIMIMKYSGRRNPTFPLRDYLRNEGLKRQLNNLRAILPMAPAASTAHAAQFSRLGYGGILVIDREGLIFDKGSRVQILGTQGLAHIGTSQAPVSVVLPRPLAVERSFAP